ncbi:hypothetical protein [Rhizobium ruizarguesonis]|uniref:hypothetical protein n=1 Tax=Rhizobium ruizarguesonis TaxID=2081791 RepID=UPI00102FAFB0|nr:hypothetical protein [Rhizobium ruizarguesonis]TBA26009.1 hypothetical protein ELH61_09480 [Rhizobium ruizarguesonis]
MAFITVEEVHSQQDRVIGTVFLNVEFIIKYESKSTEQPFTSKITYLTGSSISELIVMGAPVDITSKISNASRS